jgi:capsule synthesis protein PGA_cap
MSEFVRAGLCVWVACSSTTAPPPPPSPPSAPAAAPIAPPPRDVSIAAVGDIMAGTTYPDDLLAAVAPVLRAADVAFGNLEGPLYDGAGASHCTPGGIAERNRGRPGATTCWSFRMPVRFGAQLQDAGFDVVSIANNHIDDFGAAGRASTLAELDRLGIAYSGPPGTVAHLRVHDRAVDVIAFATYPALNNLLDLDAARALVAASAATGALTIVSFHGGREGPDAVHLERPPERHETFWTEDRGAPPGFARAMIDAGADLVVGHGPHVARALELYRGRLIAYSLGTFASYRGINVADVLGVTLILEVTLAGADGAFRSGRIRAVRQRPPGGPHLDGDGAAIRAVRALTAADIGGAAPRIADDGALTTE